MAMRVLIVGAGGVGSSAALIAARRNFFELMVIADYDEARARTLVTERLGGDARFVAARVDASSEEDLFQLMRLHGITHVVNLVDPRFVMQIFRASLRAGANYMDTAMSLSKSHPDHPYEEVGALLGEEQFALAGEWEKNGKLALVCMGVEPGLVDVFARFASDHLFSSIDELGVRDGANLVVKGFDFAPSFSIWTVIEECLNPPYIYDEAEGGWYTTEPMSEAEVFDFPGGIGPVECVNVEHEEVLLMPRYVKAKRVNFKLGLGAEFVEILKTIKKLGLHRTEPVTVRGQRVSPRDVVAACLPDPLTLGEHMTGVTCAGLLARGKGKDGAERELYLYHLCDNEWSMREFGSQAVVWQTAMNSVVALELMATGKWTGVGVQGPEAFDAVPFLQLLRDGYGQEWQIQERVPVARRAAGTPGDTGATLVDTRAVVPPM
eukprot:a176886_29.p1 GENE.a176886_29~~a176886_29.p1  ORF type:complete len:482 (-),score=208.78 a176886_29:100-1407(-)